MGTERDAQSPHPGSEQSPKLSLAGRLDGDVNGRPFSLIAKDRDITFDAGQLRTLLTLRRSWGSAVQPFLAFLRRAGLRLQVRVPWFGTVEVYPNPHYLIRLTLPRT